MNTDETDNELYDELCVVCRRLPPARGQVCEPDRGILAGQLHALIGQVQRLEVEVTPAGARRGDGIRVSTSKGTAPLPARLDALSLLGPGAVRVTPMLNPRVRHWQTTREGEVTFVRRSMVRGELGPIPHAEVVTERRTIVEWHQELVVDDDGRPVLAADDDQIGTLPPREWLGSWVRALQEILRERRIAPHTRETSWLHQYMLNDRRGALKTVEAAQGRLAALTALAANAATSQVLASMLAVKDQYRQAIRDTVSGRSTGYAGDTSRWTRTDDPLADDLAVRFGDQPASAAVTSGVAFLLLWLDEACDHPDFPVGDFAGELRSMSAELARAVGDRPDQIWLGRCPVRITDTATGLTSPCGAGIWQDPHASQVQCPRCHSTWGPRRVELLHLAVDMRRTWPVDRRRLYTHEETQTVRLPRCPACNSYTEIQWRDVTGVGEHPSVFQAAGAVCPAGCDEAKQVI